MTGQVARGEVRPPVARPEPGENPMSTPETNPQPAPANGLPARPGWVDRLLKFLGSEEEGKALDPKPAAAPPKSVVEHTPAGDVYRL